MPQLLLSLIWYKYLPFRTVLRVTDLDLMLLVNGIIINKPE